MTESKTHSNWAVVAGASSGIGRATALRLASDGWNVVVHHRQSAERAEEVVRQIAALGRRTFQVAADFGATSDRSAADDFVDEIWRRTGGLGAWIHNAGADTLTGPNAKLDFDSKLELLTRVDLWGTMRLCRAAGNRMKRTGVGAIVTIGWDQSETGMEGDSGELFAAIKAGVAGFTRSLAKSLAPFVRVNCVAPGWIKTAWGESASAAWQERVARETPLVRWGTPEDVAQTIAFLVSDRAAYLTGQTLRVNGGAVMG
jgi:3-oxoacyl-[acyl-carrier protein] reductase